MPLPSNVQIIYEDDTDISADVIVDSARFELLMSANPGSASMTVRDRYQLHSFIVGHEIRLEIDGEVAWGGYLTTVGLKYAFPVVDTVTRDSEEIEEREWVLRAVDYNILFDKRVFRNPDNITTSAPDFPATSLDGELIRFALNDEKYYDIDDGEFDLSGQVVDIVPPFDPLIDNAPGPGAWPNPGTKLRVLFEEYAKKTGAIYYFAPDKVLHYKPIEDSEARWGFSDFPSGETTVSAPALYQDVTIGFREIDASEEGGPATIVNDALIWGGSEWVDNGQTVFARAEDATSISTYGRWQTGEAHIGEDLYKSQAQVTARANVIVHGTPSGTPLTGFNLGLKHSQWMVSLTWSGERVPTLGGTPDHMTAGQLVHIDLHTFGNGTPLELHLPLRALEITFPATTDAFGEVGSWVQYRGSFGLQLNDPVSIWRYLLQQREHKVRPIAVVNSNNPAPYGARLSISPIPDVDGSTTVFQLPDDYGYVVGTTEVYVSGVRLRTGIDYTETDPDDGEFTLLIDPPDSPDWLWVVCRVTGV